MDALQQLSLMNDNAGFEADSHQERPACFKTGRDTALNDLPISEALMPNGQRIKLLKTMQTSACERNCYYCAFRAGRDVRRVTFTPDDLARTFMQLYYAKAVEGLFLSSGIIGGGVRVQDHIIATAELLRTKYQFRGYIHGKIMPGADKDQIKRLMELATRVSLNLEAPNTQRLESLAPRKLFMDELVTRLGWVEDIRQTQSPFRSWNGRWPSSATQFVVGAVDETDLELIATSEKMFRQFKLRRVYYMRFQPVKDTPLEGHAPENPWREHRLYQSSYLLRDYGFSLEDLPFGQDGNLPLHVDPKLAWAQQHLGQMPVEVNYAGREDLLRIPGIGHKGADQIIMARRERKLTSLQQLDTLGVLAKRAAPFILLNGRKPEHQLRLV